MGLEDILSSEIKALEDEITRLERSWDAEMQVILAERLDDDRDCHWQAEKIYNVRQSYWRRIRPLMDLLSERRRTEVKDGFFIISAQHTSDVAVAA